MTSALFVLGSKTAPTLFQVSGRAGGGGGFYVARQVVSKGAKALGQLNFLLYSNALSAWLGTTNFPRQGVSEKYLEARWGHK